MAQAAKEVTEQSATLKQLLLCSGKANTGDDGGAGLMAAIEGVAAAALANLSGGGRSSDSNSQELLSGLTEAAAAAATACFDSAGGGAAALSLARDAVVADAGVARDQFGVEAGVSALLASGGKWYVPKASDPLFAQDIASIELGEKRSAVRHCHNQPSQPPLPAVQTTVELSTMRCCCCCCCWCTI